MDAPLRYALWGGFAVGFGLSGFVDAAVFHNILQWHHFVMTDDPAARLRSDGWLMVALWLASVAGILGLWRAARLSRHSTSVAGRMAWGGALLGAGAFNGGDVLLDHFVLGLHRLNENSASYAPDLVWLALSALLLAAGALLVRQALRAAREDAPTRRSARS